MKKILFYLFCAITLIANASMPVVNDSVLVEPKYDKEFSQWALMDSINGVPTAASMYYSNWLEKFGIELYELENILTNKKDQYIVAGVLGENSVEVTSCSYEEIKVIIDALRKIYDYCQKPFVDDYSERVSYVKKLLNANSIRVDLLYNSEDNTWNGIIGINGVYCRLKKGDEDLPTIISLMEKALHKYEQREQLYKEPVFIKKIIEGDICQYYFDDGNNLVQRLVAKDEINREYSKEIIAKKHANKINNKLNDIVSKEYSEFSELGEYGGFDVIIDENGCAVDVKLMLSNRVTDSISDNTKGFMLKTVKKYKFTPISNKDKLNEVEYVKVYIPLSSKGVRKNEDLLDSGIEESIKSNYVEPKLIVEEKGEYKQYYIDNGDGLVDKTKGIIGNNSYSESLFKENEVELFNLKINEKIKDNYKQLKDISDYGVVEVAINSLGHVVFTKIILKEVVANTLDERAIENLIHWIDDYSFMSFKEEDYPDVKLIKVYIPLKGRP